MSKNSITRFITPLFVLLVSVALVGADLVVLAQNANSSQEEPTRGGMMTSQNENTSGGTTRRRRRPRRRARANANMSGDTTMSGDAAANANTTGDASMTGAAGQANANMGMGTGTTRRGRRNRRRATTDMSGGGMTGMTANANSGGEQTDLSGTYTGNVNYPEGGLNGAATLTITGNNFTITPEGGGSAVNGRVTAVTTRGYTGVTMMFGDPTAPPATQNPPPPPLPAVSLQARRTGDRVTLKSVPGEKRQFSFSSGGATGGTGRRRGRRARSGMSGMGTDTTTTSTTTTTGDMSGTTTTGDSMGATTTGTGRRRRRGRRNRTGGINSNMNTNGSMGGNTNGNTTPPE